MSSSTHSSLSEVRKAITNCLGSPYLYAVNDKRPYVFFVPPEKKETIKGLLVLHDLADSLVLTD